MKNTNTKFYKTPYSVAGQVFLIATLVQDEHNAVFQHLVIHKKGDEIKFLDIPNTRIRTSLLKFGPEVERSLERDAEHLAYDNLIYPYQREVSYQIPSNFLVADRSILFELAPKKTFDHLHKIVSISLDPNLREEINQIVEVIDGFGKR